MHVARDRSAQCTEFSFSSVYFFLNCCSNGPSPPYTTTAESLQRFFILPVCAHAKSGCDGRWSWNASQSQCERRLVHASFLSWLERVKIKREKSFVSFLSFYDPTGRPPADFFVSLFSFPFWSSAPRLKSTNKTTTTTKPKKKIVE